MKILTYDQAKRFYDRLGSGQDWQAFYEDPAVDRMVSDGRFDEAHSVCEFGCGTGRLAEKLLTEFLPSEATYLCLDISDTMVRLANKRLAPWSGRARIVQTAGEPSIPMEDGTADRVISAYVLDLLSEEDTRRFLAEAGRVLRGGGLLCLVSLTHGQGWWSRAIASLWSKVQAWRPQLVGGCRPVELTRYLDAADWTVQTATAICRFGVCSEAVVAVRAA